MQKGEVPLCLFGLNTMANYLQGISRVALIFVASISKINELPEQHFILEYQPLKFQHKRKKKSDLSSVIHYPSIPN